MAGQPLLFHFQQIQLANKNFGPFTPGFKLYLLMIPQPLKMP